MSVDPETIETYDLHAAYFADKFEREGVLDEKLNKLFSMLNVPEPVVFDVGCGSGKYGKAVAKRGGRYMGLDASKELVSIAKRENPDVAFFVSDMVEYAYPSGIDIALIITTILHIPKKDVQELLGKISRALNPKGLIFLTCKEGTYKGERVDMQGKIRKFYFYTEEDLKSVFPQSLTMLELERRSVGANIFLEVILQKET